MIMKTYTTKWLVAGVVGAGMLVFATGATAAGGTEATASRLMPSQHLQLAAAHCGGVVKASAMATDKMADDKMAKDDMKSDEMAKDAMKDDKMAKDAAMKTDGMAKAADCEKKDTM